jgi:hypothetical protein
MVGWIALAVFVVGGLAFGLNSALGSEPAPSAKKASHAQKAPASVSTDSKPTAGGAVSIAQKLFEAVQNSDNANNGDSSTNGPLNFISNLAKNHGNGK